MGRARVFATGALGVLSLVYAACGVPYADSGASGGSGGVIERGRPLCFDGLDNDGDGLVDCDDPYCDNVCVEICTDYVDNDGDGFNGCDDPKCAGQDCFEPHEICWNELDEDENGVHGCEDPACFEDPECVKQKPEVCDNGVDDNLDGQADCDDPECRLAPTCEQCADGIDNDADGLTDCEDLPRCRVECGLVEKCTGGLDEDADGLVDCKDADCSDDGACIVGCRVRQLADPLGVPTYEDTCRSGYVCTCPGAPGCPTPNPNAGQIIGDLIGASELCDEPQTCEQGGGCRPVDGVYTLRFRRAGIPVDDPINDPELYVVVNGERISGVGDDYHYYCDDCYRVIRVPETSMLHVELWDQDVLDIPDSSREIDHSDLIMTCDFFLGETTLKQRALTCWRSEGIVELTIEPHVTP